MRETLGAIDSYRLAEAVRQACLDAAQEGYEHAALSGLCHEGAWEVAVGAIRSLDVAALAARPLEERQSARTGLGDLVAALADRFASPGPPAAGSGAAATGAIAAGLVEWAASLSEQKGPGDFRNRAHAIARRAAVLRVALAWAGEQDAEVARALFRSDVTSDARCRATDSLLDIATRCAQTATLAAEVAGRGHGAIRPDVSAALRLAAKATECALDLAEENLQPDANERWALDARRRAWRARLLLQRAAPILRAGEPDPQCEEAE